MNPKIRTHGITLAVLTALLAGGCRLDMDVSGTDSAAPTPVVRASVTTPGETAGIPADAAAFDGHHYKVFDHDGTWHEAKSRCEAMGGHLACIETQAEQRFIASLANGRYLSLGASDEAAEDTWVWVNGTPFTFTSWLDGQPNNYGGDENYLATYDGGDWVDVAVEGHEFWMPTGFICEWDH